MAQDTEASLKALLDHARGAASAYQAALADDMPEEDARWLRQGADEHAQTVRLLMPHIEGLLGAHKPTWLAATVQAGKAKVAKLWGGLHEVLHVLVDAEQNLVKSFDDVLQMRSLPVELKALCEDQQACAKTRLGHMRQREKANSKAEATASTTGPLEHRSLQVNMTKAPSTDNSDC